MSSIEQKNTINAILSYLEMTYKSNDNEKRKQAEEKLKEFQNYILINLSESFILLKSNTLSKDLSNSLMLYIKNIIITQKKKETLNNNIVENIIQSLIVCLLDVEFPSKYQIEMNKCFEEIINCHLLEENDQIIQSLINLFQSKILSGDINPASYKGVAYIFENILCATCVTDKNANQIMIVELNCCEVMLQKIIDLLENVKIIDNDNKSTILTYINGVKVIFDLLLNISVHSQKTFHNSEHFSYILQNILQKYGLKMLSLNFEENNENVIKTKTKIYKFIISLLNVSKDFFGMKEIIELHKKIILISFNIFNKDSRLFQKINENLHFENMVQQVIIYLSKIIFKSVFQEELTTFLIPFTKNIIFPILISNKKDLDDIEEDEDGTNYSNYLYDLVLSKKGKNIKVSLAKFLGTGCKKNQDYINYLIQYSMYLIQISLNIQTEPCSLISPDDYMISNQVNDVQRIETSFLVLCIISGHLSSNHQEILLDFIQKHYQILICEKVCNVSVIKQRICFFISVYIEHFLSLNKIRDDFFMHICGFLFFNIFQNRNNKIAQYESFESLKIILISNQKFKENFIVVSHKYIDEFISFSRKTNNVLFFDLLNEIINSISTENIILEITKNIFIRILTEISPRKLSHSRKNEMQVDQGLNSKYRIIINKCFLIIKKIFSNQIFISNHFSEIDELITPLLMYMKYPNKIDFDEDFIQIMIVLLKTLKSIPPCAMKLLPNLCQYLRKKKGLTLDLFELLNAYIIYSNDIIENYEDFCKIIFKNFKKSFAKESNVIISSYLGTCLMQILLLNSKKAPEQIVIDLISFLTERINGLLFGEKSNHSDYVISDSLQIVSLAMITLLSNIFVNYSRIASSLISIDQLIKFLEYQVAYQNFTSYQIKLLVVGLCSFLRESNLPQCYDNKIGQLITILTKFIIKIHDRDSKIEKINSVNQMKNNLTPTNKTKTQYDDEVEFEIENNSNFFIKEMQCDTFIQEKKDYAEIDKIIINPIKSVNHYYIYKEILESFNKQYPSDYITWLNSCQFSQNNQILLFISSLESYSVNQTICNPNSNHNISISTNSNSNIY